MLTSSTSGEMAAISVVDSENTTFIQRQKLM